MKLLIPSLILVLGFSLPAFAGPKVTCTGSGSFIDGATGVRTSMNDIDIVLGTVPNQRGNFQGEGVADIGYGVAVRIHATFVPKGSIQYEGQDWLVTNMKLYWKDSKGQVTYLVDETEDSDSGPHLGSPQASENTMISSSALMMNPEISTAAARYGKKTTPKELVQLGLLRKFSINHAHVVCAVVSR